MNILSFGSVMCFIKNLSYSFLNLKFWYNTKFLKFLNFAHIIMYY